MYPPGFNLYRSSRGVKRPVVVRTTEGEAMKMLEDKELVYEKTIAVTNGAGDVLNVINYDEFGQIFKENPDIIVGVLNALAKRTIHLMNEYKGACKVINELESEMNGNAEKNKSGIQKYVEEYFRVQRYSSLFDAE